MWKKLQHIFFCMVDRWFELCLVVFTLMHSERLFRYPKMYDIPFNMRDEALFIFLNNYYLGCAYIFVSLFYLVFMFTKFKKLRYLGLYMIMSTHCYAGYFLYLRFTHGLPTPSYLFPLLLLAIAIGVSLRGEYK